ncbi:MAG: SRPBCC domain-containing protein [Deltaproteobacteria bacterium]|nr:SRPBCC domain-containing protein [Deltaproteobacteria bacterium]
MASRPQAAPRRRITLERTYQATLEEVWEMWTTRQGIEAWWGPDGFEVKVKKLELRPGGELLYDMIATGPDQIAFMKQANAPLSTAARIRITEVVPPRRLAYLHAADFIPGVEPYDVAYLVELAPEGKGTKLTLTFEAMHDEIWTGRAVQGWEMELARLGKALAR